MRKNRGFFRRAMHLSLLAAGCGLLLSVSGGSRGFSAAEAGGAVVAAGAGGDVSSVAPVSPASAGASGAGGITLGEWQAASELAPDKVGSFRVEVRRPGGESFSRLFIDQWRDAIVGAADTQAFSDFAKRQARNDILRAPREDFTAWLRARNTAAVESFYQDSADTLSGYLTAQAESGALALDFVRTIDVDFSSSLGNRRWQTGVSALGALRESGDDAIVWQLRASGGEDDAIGGNAGLIYRAVYNEALLGANVFLDYEDSSVYGTDFWRGSFGVEYRAAYVDVFANQYFRISDAILDARDNYIYTKSGTDVEVSFKPFADYDVSGGLTYYNWRGEYGEDDDKGLRLNVGGRFPVQALPGLRLELQADKPSGGDMELGGKVSYSYTFGAPAAGGGGGGGSSASGFDARSHFFDPVRREYSQRIGVVSALSLGDVLATVLVGGATVSYNHSAPDLPLAAGEAEARLYNAAAVTLDVSGAGSTLRLTAGAWYATIYAGSSVHLQAYEGRYNNRISVELGTLYLHRTSGGTPGEVAMGEVVVSLGGTALEVGINGANGQVTGMVMEGMVDVYYPMAGLTPVINHENGAVVNMHPMSGGSVMMSYSLNCGGAAGRDASLRFVSGFAGCAGDAYLGLEVGATVVMQAQGEVLTVTTGADGMHSARGAEAYAGRWSRYPFSPDSGAGLRASMSVVAGAGAIVYEGATVSVAAGSRVQFHAGGADGDGADGDGGGAAASGALLYALVRAGALTDIGASGARVDCAANTASGGEGVLSVLAACGERVTFAVSSLQQMQASSGAAVSREYAAGGGNGNYAFKIDPADGNLELANSEGATATVRLMPYDVGGSSHVLHAAPAHAVLAHYVAGASITIQAQVMGNLMARSSVPNTPPPAPFAFAAHAGAVTVRTELDANVAVLTLGVVNALGTVSYALSGAPAGSGVALATLGTVAAAPAVITLTGAIAAPQTLALVITASDTAQNFDNTVVAYVTVIAANAGDIVASLALTDSVADGVYEYAAVPDGELGDITQVRNTGLSGLVAGANYGYELINAPSAIALSPAALDAEGTGGAAIEVAGALAAGTYTLSIAITDDHTQNADLTVLATIRLLSGITVVAAGQLLRFSPDKVTLAIANYTNYTYTARPTLGVSPYSFSVMSAPTVGSVSIDSGTGEMTLSNLPAGSEVQVRAVDALGYAATLAVEIAAPQQNVYADGDIILFGGNGSYLSGIYHRDMWINSSGSALTEWTKNDSDSASGSGAAADVLYAAVATFAGKIYIIGGLRGDYHTEYSNQVWSSANGGKTWEKSSAPWTERSGAGAVVFDKALWVFGGVDGENILTDVWRTIDGKNWTLEKSDALAEDWLYAFGVLGNTAYAALGDELWYSGNMTTWQKHSDLPDTIGHGPIFTVSDNKLFVAGGHGPSGTVFRYDRLHWFDGESWESNDPSFKPRYLGPMVARGNQLIVLGGDTGIANNDIWVNSEPTSQTNWEYISGGYSSSPAITPWARRLGHAAVVVNTTYIPAAQVPHFTADVSLAQDVFAVQSTGTVAIISLAGGIAPYTLAISGAHAELLSLDYAGGSKATVHLTAAISEVKQFAATLQADDNHSSTPSRYVTLSINIIAPLALSVTLTRKSNFSAYQTGEFAVVTVSGGLPAYTFFISGNTPYFSLAFDAEAESATLALSDSPANGATLNVTVAVKDANLQTKELLLTLAITISAPSEDLYETGDVILVGGDGGGFNTKDIWISKANNALTAWSKIESGSGAGSAGDARDPAVVAFAGKIYILGGCSALGCRNDVWHSADGGASWEKYNAPWDGRGVLGALVFNNALWIFGGFDGEDKSDVWKSADGLNWTEVEEADFFSHSGGLANFASGVLGGTVYLTGGSAGSYHNSSLWYSTDMITWSAHSAVPDQPVGGWSYFAVAGDKFFVIDRIDWGTSHPYVQWFDGKKWGSYIAPFSNRRAGALVAREGQLILMAGIDESGAEHRINDIWSNSDPTNPQTWKRETEHAPWSVRDAHKAVVFDSSYMPPNTPAFALNVENAQSDFKAQTTGTVALISLTGGTAPYTMALQSAHAELLSLNYSGGAGATIYLTAAVSESMQFVATVRADDSHALTPSRYVTLSINIIGPLSLSVSYLKNQFYTYQTGDYAALDASGGLPAYTLNIVGESAYFSLTQDTDAAGGTLAFTATLNVAATLGVTVALQDSYAKTPEYRLTLTLTIAATPNGIYPDGDIILIGGNDIYNVHLRDMWINNSGSALTAWSKNETASGAGGPADVFYPAVATFAGKIYITGGARGTVEFTSEVWSSADGGKTWKAQSPAPWSARRHHGIAVFENALWIFGGHDSSGNMSDVWRTVDGENWTRESENGFLPEFPSSYGVLGDTAYVAYDTELWHSSDMTTWQKHAASPQMIGSSPIFAVAENKFYIAGGHGPAGTAFRYDRMQWFDGEKWKSYDPPFAPRYIGAMVARDNQLIVLGGDVYPYATPGALNDIWVNNNPTSESDWKLVSSYGGTPWARRIGHAAVVNNKSYIPDAQVPYFTAEANVVQNAFALQSTGTVAVVSLAGGIAPYTLGLESAHADLLSLGYAGGAKATVHLIGGATTAMKFAATLQADDSHSSTPSRYVTLIINIIAPLSLSVSYLKNQFYTYQTGNYAALNASGGLPDYTFNIVGESAYFSLAQDAGAAGGTLAFTATLNVAATLGVTVALQDFHPDTPEYRLTLALTIAASRQEVYSDGDILLWASTDAGQANLNDVWVNSKGSALSLWSEQTSVSVSVGLAGFHNAGVLAFAGEIYILGGVQNGANSNEVWHSADGGKTWENYTADWNPRHGLGAIVFNNAMWVFGGHGSARYYDAWKSEDGRNWENAGAFHPGLWNFAFGVLKGTVYATGGSSAFTSKSLWHSTDMQTWATLAPPEYRIGLGCYAVVDNKIFFIDIQNKRVQWFDGEEWGKYDSPSFSSGCSAVERDGELILIENIDGGATLNDIWISSNPASETSWQKVDGAIPWSPRYLQGAQVALVYDGAYIPDGQVPIFTAGVSLAQDVFAVQSTGTVAVVSLAGGIAPYTLALTGAHADLLSLDYAGGANATVHLAAAITLSMQFAATLRADDNHASTPSRYITLSLYIMDPLSLSVSFIRDKFVAFQTGDYAAFNAMGGIPGYSFNIVGESAYFALTQDSGAAGATLALTAALENTATTLAVTVALHDSDAATPEKRLVLSVEIDQNPAQNLYGNGDIILLGGESRNGATVTDVWTNAAADELNEWNKQAEGVGSVADVADAAMAAFAGRVFVLGGIRNGAASNEIWHSKDGANWTKANDAAWPARYGHAALVFDHALWVVGGGNNGDAMIDVWRSVDGLYWQEISATGFAPAVANFAIGAINGTVYVAGGRVAATGNEFSTDFWSSTDMLAWHKHADNLDLQPIGWAPYYTVADNKFFVIGGYADSEGGRQRIVQWYDGERWQHHTPDFSARYRGALVAREGKLILLGGRDRGGKNSNLKEIWTNATPTIASGWQEETGTIPWTQRARAAAVVFDGDFVPVSQVPDFAMSVEVVRDMFGTDSAGGAVARISLSGGIAPYALALHGTQAHLLSLQYSGGAAATLHLQANISVAMQFAVTVQADDDHIATPARNVAISVRIYEKFALSAQPVTVNALKYEGAYAAVNASGGVPPYAFTLIGGSPYFSFVQNSGGSGGTVALTAQLLAGAVATVVLGVQDADANTPQLRATLELTIVKPAQEVYDDGDIILLGGDVSDIWINSSGSALTTWSKITVATDAVGSSHLFNPAVAAFGGKIYILGGLRGLEYSKEVWSSADGGSTWQQMPSARWPGRYEHGALVFDNALWVFGGFNGQGAGVLTDVWRTIDGENWTHESSSFPQFWGSFAYGVVGATVYAAKGEQLWHSGDMKTWTRHSADPPIGIYRPASSVYDGNLVVSGRYNSVSGWVQWFDGEGWENYSTSFGLQDSAMVTRGSHVVLMGGNNEAENDTNAIWMSADPTNANGWTLASSGGSAPWAARSSHAAVVYDGSYIPTAQVPHLSAAVAESHRLTTHALGVAAVLSVSGGLAPYSLELNSAHGKLLSLEYAGGALATVHLIAAASDAMKIAATLHVEDSYVATPDDLLAFNITIVLQPHLYTDGDILLLGGEHGGGDAVDDLWINAQDENLALWSKQTASGSGGVADVRDAAVAAFAGRVFVLGGERDGAASNEIWHSEDGINWTMNTAPWPARWGHGAAALNGALWIFGGGNNGDAMKDVWRSTDGLQWARQSADGFDPAVVNFASGVLGDTIYVAGGRVATSGNDYSSDFWSSADMLTWHKHTVAAQVPKTIGWSPYSTVADDKFFVIGGYAHDNGGRQRIVQWYDGEKWQHHTPPFSSRYRGALAARDGKLILLGGRDKGGSATNINEIWTNATPTSASGWAQQGTVAWTARARAAAVVFDGSYIPIAQAPVLTVSVDTNKPYKRFGQTGAVARLSISGGIGAYSLALHSAHANLLSLEYAGEDEATLYLTSPVNASLLIGVTLMADDSYSATPAYPLTMSVDVVSEVSIVSLPAQIFPYGIRLLHLESASLQLSGGRAPYGFSYYSEQPPEYALWISQDTSIDLARKSPHLLTNPVVADITITDAYSPSASGKITLRPVRGATLTAGGDIVVTIAAQTAPARLHSLRMDADETFGNPQWRIAGINANGITLSADARSYFTLAVSADGFGAALSLLSPLAALGEARITIETTDATALTTYVPLVAPTRSTAVVQVVSPVPIYFSPGSISLPAAHFTGVAHVARPLAGFAPYRFWQESSSVLPAGSAIGVNADTGELTLTNVPANASVVIGAADTANVTAFLTVHIANPPPLELSVSISKSEFLVYQTGEAASFVASGGFPGYAFSIVGAGAHVSLAHEAGGAGATLHLTAPFTVSGNRAVTIAVDDLHADIPEARATLLLKIADDETNNGYDAGDIVLLGGYFAGNDHTSDLWLHRQGDSLTLWQKQSGASGDDKLADVRDAAVAAFAGRLFVLGGERDYGASNEIWHSADGADWTKAANAAWSARWGHGAVVHNKALWVFGGTSGGAAHTDVWRSLDGLHWTEASADGFDPAVALFAAGALNGTVYVAGGRKPDVPQDVSDFWHSADMLSWTKHAAQPLQKIGRGPYHAASDGKFFVIGGFVEDDGGRQQTAQWYDGEKWSAYALPFSGRYWGPLVARGGELLLLGGRHRSGKVSNTNEIWHSSEPTSAGAWKRISGYDIPWTGRARSAAAVFDGAAAIPDALVPDLVAGIDILQSTLWFQVTGAVAAVSVAGGIAPHSLSFSSAHADLLYWEYAGGAQATIHLTAIVADPMQLAVTIAANDSYDSASPEVRLTLFVEIAKNPAQNLYGDGDILLLGGESRNGATVTDVWTNAAADELNEWNKQAEGVGSVADVADAAMAAFAGQVFVLGGVRGGAASNEIWHSKDGANWTKAGNAAWPARYGHAALVFDHALWVAGGGNNGDAMTDVWRSVDGLHWQEISANGFAPAVANFAIGAINGTVYVAGGRVAASGNEFSTDFWSSTDMLTWHKHADNLDLQPIGWAPYYTVADNKLFVIGGFADTEGGRQRIVQWYDGERWQHYTPEFTSRYRGALVARDGKLILLGGRDRGGKSHNLKQIWTNDTPTIASGWQEENVDIPWTGRARAAAVVFDGDFVPVEQVPNFIQTVETIRETFEVDSAGGEVARISLSGGIAPYALALSGAQAHLLSLQYDGGAEATVHLLANISVAMQFAVTVQADDDHIATPTRYAAVSVRIYEKLAISAQPVTVSALKYEGAYAAISASGGVPPYAFTLVGGSPYFSFVHDAGAASGTVALTAQLFAGAVASVVVGVEDADAHTPQLRATLALTVVNPAQEIYEDGDIILLGGDVSDIWVNSSGSALTAWISVSAATDAVGASHFYNPAVVAFGGKIYILGGLRDTEYSKEVWSSADGGYTWQQMPSAPWTGRYNLGALVFDNALWVFGGINGQGVGALTDVWRTIDGENWTKESSDFPFSWGGFAYGALGATVYAAKYDELWHSGDMKTWVEHEEDPSLAIHNPYFTVADGKLIAMGQYSYGGGWVQWFDGESWGKYDTSFGLEDAAMVARGNQVIVLGGNKSNGSDTNEIWVSADATNASGWALASSLAITTWTARSDHAAVVYDGSYIPTAQVPHLSAEVVESHRLTTHALGVAAVLSVSGGLAPYSLELNSAHGKLLSLEYKGGALATVHLIAAASDAMKIAATLRVEDSYVATPDDLLAFNITIVLQPHLYTDGDILLLGGEHGGGDDTPDLWINAQGKNLTMWSKQTASGVGGVADVRDAAVAAFAGKVFVLGGERDGAASNEIWHSSDGIEWTINTAPWPARYGHAALVFDYALWVVGGGSNGNAMTDVWRSVDGLHWTQESADGFDPAVVNFASGVLGDTIYVAGGRVATSGNDYSSDFWSSADMLTWHKHTVAAQVPKTIGWSPYSTVADDKFFVIGGYAHDNGGRQRIVQWYDGEKWRHHTPPFSSRYRGALAAREGKLILLGGRNKGGKAANINEVWTNATPTSASGWTQQGTVAWTGRARSAAVVFDNSYVPASEVPNFEATVEIIEKAFKVNSSGGAAARISLVDGVAPYTLALLGEHADLVSLQYDGGALATVYLTAVATSVMKFAVTVRADDSHPVSPTRFAAITIRIIEPLPLSYSLIRTFFPSGQTGNYAGLSVSGGGGADYSFSIAGGSPYFSLIHDAGAETATLALVATLSVATVDVTIVVQETGISVSESRLTLSLVIADTAENVYADGDIILFGGSTQHGQLAQSDMWVNSNGSALTQWTKNDSASGSGGSADVQNPAVVAFAGKIFIIGGARGVNHTVYSNQVWSSANGGQTWEKTSAPWTERAGAGAVVFDNALWVFGGHDGDIILDDIWRTIDGKHWTLESSDGLPGHAYAFPYGALGDAVYAGFGSELWYSGNMTSWQKHSDLPSTIGHAPIFAVFDNKLFVAGGAIYYNPPHLYRSDRLHWFDGVSWKSNDPSFPPRYHGSMVARGNQLIVLGGDKLGGGNNDIWVNSDPINQTEWVLASWSGTPWARRLGHAAVVVNTTYIPAVQVPHLLAEVASLNTLTVQMTGVAAVVSLAGGIAPYTFELESAHANLLSIEHEEGENTATVRLTSAVTAATTIGVTVRVDDNHDSTPTQTVSFDIEVVAGAP